MPIEDASEWRSSWKVLPYRDYTGRRIWFPANTQRRPVVRDGQEIFEYREVPETWEDILDHAAW